MPSLYACTLLAICLGASNFVAGETSESYLPVVNTTRAGFDLESLLYFNSTYDYFDEDGAADGESRSIDDDPRIINGEDEDVVAKFLGLVEEYKKNKKNCTKGTSYNLGAGVVRQYGLNRFLHQALVAVNRANFLTRIWKSAEPEVLNSEFLLYSAVRNMVEGDPDMFAAGNCYDANEYKDYYLFCPYAYRMPDGRINVKDLSVEYKYNNSNEWFYHCRVNANKRLKSTNLTVDVWQKPYNDTTQGDFQNDSVILVTYGDGHWSKPYFDCGGGDIWMMTYTVPFFGFKNGTFFFKGTSGIDIDLEKVDINQCPQTDGSLETNVFAGSHRCRTVTTRCDPVRGLGFRRGSYKCVCKDSFYFPNVTAKHRYFFGTDVEHEYEKAKRKEPNAYYSGFACLPCAPGCETCEDGRPCILALNWIQRSILLGIAGLIMCCIPLLIWFTVQYREVKVLKASSPLLMRIILLGAFFLYCPQIVGYFEASVLTCCLRFWFREIGFSISYGALLLKTWRISVVFRVRSAQRIKISDGDLIKRLVIIVMIFAVYLSGRTIAGRPKVVKGKHTSGLQAFQCSSDWWDHSAAIAELLFLLWGVRLCIMVRKAPSEFNESRFISWAIYNETLLSLFLNVSMIFFQDPFPSNPDLLYLVVFIHSQLTTTVTLAFLFGSKAYHVYKNKGKDQQAHSTMLARTGKFVTGSKSPTAVLSTFSSGNPMSIGDKMDESENESFLEKDIQEEFRRLYTQLELLKQRNMKLGNPHLQHKLSAMTEAAKKDDLPDSTPSSPNVNGKRVVINLDDYHEATSL